MFQINDDNDYLIKGIICDYRLLIKTVDSRKYG